MLDFFMQLSLFTAKAFIILLVALLLLSGIIAIISRSKIKAYGRLQIKNLNEKYQDTKEELLREISSKKSFKQFLKTIKKEKKTKSKSAEKSKNIYVLNFNGDIKASGVTNLREEITGILSIATTKDEVVVRLESPGGLVNAYGLAASQLLRIREKNIPLTVIIDKMAASGGYLMACVANKILAAPFSIIGSIGVIVQLPNFHRLLKEKHIDFEQHTAGEFKRTITLFGHNTQEAREKLQQEIEEVHQLFKQLIMQYRPQVDMHKVATGEHWLGQQALDLQLVDALQTSDTYLLEKNQTANLYEICFQTKKTLGSRLTAAANLLQSLFIYR
ncbi:MAG: putative protease SohB [uncultured bacterium]|nr:MAG: putative protease SohB [uncultured bacterium]OGT47456.1 MAG: protease SohB [Gammaproteobacteria bacterium RIFCSPHIGHO2_12_FULL_41_20]